MISSFLKTSGLQISAHLNNLLINRRSFFGSYFNLQCHRNNQDETTSLIVNPINGSNVDIPNNWLNWDYGFEIDKNIPSKKSKIDQLWKNVLNDSEVLTAIEALTPFCSLERQQRINSVANQRTDRVRFVFENPINVNNVWAALRSLDSFGIQFVDVILPEISETYSQRKTEKRTTMNAALGSQQWLTLYEHRNTTECLNRLRKEGYSLFATDLSAKSKLLRQFIHERHEEELSDIINSTRSTTGRKIAIIMGNEELGISQEARDLVDDCFYIPMYGFAESLNLSIATAVVCSALDYPFLRHDNLWKTSEDHESPTDYGRGLLSPHLELSLKNRIMLTWLTRSVRGSMALLRRAGLPITGDSRYQTIGKSTSRP